jgi:hypothetical protein
MIAVGTGVISNARILAMQQRYPERNWAVLRWG